MSEFQDEYSESVEVEFRKLEGALLNDAVNLLAPSEPICLPATATVHEAITKMLASRRAAVVIVDGERRPIGIVTVSDVVKWLAEIFPEAVLNLRPGDEIKHPLQVDAG